MRTAKTKAAIAWKELGSIQVKSRIEKIASLTENIVIGLENALFVSY